MIPSLKQKLKDIFSKKTTYLSAKILLTALIFSLVFPLLAQPVAQADTPTPRGCSIINTSNFTSKPTIMVSKPKVSHDEKFSLYFSGNVSSNAVSGCSASDLSQYKISLLVTGNLDKPDEQIAYLLGNYNSQKTYDITFDSKTNAFRERIDNLTMDGIFDKDTIANGGGNGDNYIYIYFHKLGDKPSDYFKDPVKIVRDDTSVTNPSDPAFSKPPISDSPSTGSVAAEDSGTINFDDFKFGVKIKSATNDPHRNFYRISNDGYIAVPDPKDSTKHTLITFSAFDSGADKGIPVTLNLADGKATNVTSLLVGTTFISYSQYGKDYPNLSYFFDGSHRLSKISLVSIEKSLQEDKAKGICAPSVFSSSQYACEASKIKESKPGIKALTKTTDSDFPIALGSPQSLASIGIKGDNGAVVTMNLLPNIDTEITWGQWISKGIAPWTITPGTAATILSPAGFSYGENVQQVYFQIYATKDELDKHKDDAVPNTVPDYKDAVTGNTQSSGSTAAQTLYAFILRVIISIILVIQTVIYRVFAFLLVPVLKAILTVRPYKDNFVNIIYPGWLILRNLANIFFIIALLVVGLKTLFQQAASSTTRSFITKLVLMALLVNFSLVISQGIVGIADTVQAQFLPDNSRVIEALGAKLMVEPLKSFRASTVGDTGFFQDTKDSDLSFADVVKPIVLLILTVAAFWSFVAIAAFLLVRLVVLWVLYMTSPIAYVGGILPETKSYASQWWKEFIRYVTITPVLVFFLNIAALMATVFADANSNSTQIFNIGDASTSSDLVLGVLTVLTHFIVLGVLFAGMKFAMSSGTYGAKAITGFAQKGFKNTFKKPAQFGSWASGYLGNKAATAAEKREKFGLAKAITAVTNPIDATKAAKKKYLDKPREAQADNEKRRLNNLFGLENDSKLGKSLKKARELAKELGDTPIELKQALGDGYKKKDGDKASAAMLKMGQEGQFKDMLEEAGELMHGDKKHFSKNAAGLSSMTEELVNKGVISKNQRRDLLNEFDNQAKKKKSNVQYGGNLTYDPVKKENLPRSREQRGPNDTEDRFSATENDLSNENSWIRAHIKGRTGNNPKGVLKGDLKEMDKSVAVTKNANNEDVFHMGQIGVFATQSEKALSKSKTWEEAMESQSDDKIEKMRSILFNQDGTANVAGRNRTREQFVQYYQQTTEGGMSREEALAKADLKLTALEDGMGSTFGGNRTGGEQNTGNGGGGNRGRNRRGTPEYEVVNAQGERITGNTPAPEADEDDGGDDDDDEQARTTRVVTNVANNTQPTGGQAAQVMGQTTAPAIGDAVGGGNVNLSRGKASISSGEKESKKKNKKNKGSEEEVEPKTIGFLKGKVVAADPKNYEYLRSDKTRLNVPGAKKESDEEENKRPITE